MAGLLDSLLSKKEKKVGVLNVFATPTGKICEEEVPFDSEDGKKKCGFGIFRNPDGTEYCGGPQNHPYKK